MAEDKSKLRIGFSGLIIDNYIVCLATSCYYCDCHDNTSTILSFVKPFSIQPSCNVDDGNTAKCYNVDNQPNNLRTFVCLQ